VTVDELVAKLQAFPGYWTVATSDSELGYPPVELVETAQPWVPNGGEGDPTPVVVLS
jgi:hypothetical protein